MLNDSTPDTLAMTNTAQDVPEKARRVRRVGPYSRPGALASVDRRTKPARLLKQITAELTAHIGGAPTAAERVLIGRLAMLSLQCAQLDERVLAGGVMTEHDSRTFLAWSNSLERGLHRLGLKGVAAAPPTLDDILRAARAQPSPERHVAAPRTSPGPLRADPGTHAPAADNDTLAGNQDAPE